MATMPTLSKTVTRDPGDSAGWLKSARYRLAIGIEKIVSTAWITRPIFNLLRIWHPIVLVRGKAIVTKYRDVRAVLADTDHFDVNYPKAGPDQIVGMADTPEYRRLKTMLMSGLGTNFQSDLETIVDKCARKILPTTSKPFDAVSEYSRVIAIDLTDSYLGIPANPDDMKRWTRTILRDVFLNMLNDPTMAAEADLSRGELNRHVDALIAATNANLNAGRQPPDNFFGRLFTHARQKGASDDTIRNLIAGLVTALADNISNSIARSMKYLLDNPVQLKGAANAAKANNTDLLRHYIFEALRFNPETPLLFRCCTKAATLASLTSRTTTIPAGTLVVAALEGAMFDGEPDAFPDAKTFSTKRPLDDYLHFGWGMHRCFGRGVAEAVLPAAVGALLRLPNLRRVKGLEGRVTYDGAFPKRMLVEFE